MPLNKVCAMCIICAYQKSGLIDNSWIFRNISKSSSEILVEVWDQGQKVGDADLFMGLGIGNQYDGMF